MEVGTKRFEVVKASQRNEPPFSFLKIDAYLRALKLAEGERERRPRNKRTWR